jgi:P-type conjugative transfer protein TrbG
MTSRLWLSLFLLPGLAGSVAPLAAGAQEIPGEATPAPATVAPATSLQAIPQTIPSQEAAVPSPPDPVAAAVAGYTTTGRAPVLDQDGVVLFPFGLGEPAINCLPGVLCDLELQAGESLQGIAVGDPTWVTEQLTSGPDTPHVIVQPKGFGSSTTLIVTTTRRTYVVQLTASSGRAITRRAAFYYPRDVIRLAERREALRERQEQAVVAEITDPSRLNFDYRISRDRGAPDRVFDDGIHTYVGWGARLPGEAPVLLGIDAEGHRALLNYRTSRDGSWYIVDAVLQGFELKLGKTTLKIDNRSFR